MDGRQFDILTRSFAERSTRRTLLRRGAVIGGAIGTFAAVMPTSAARRGSTGASTVICRPNGDGSYYRTMVPTILLNTYLNDGAIVSDCCADSECGESSSCMTAYCDFDAGACAVGYADYSACARPGCADGFCLNGACNDPTPRLCDFDPACYDCTYDACEHSCNCNLTPCYPDDYQCMHAYCDGSKGGCVTEPMNEESPCDTFGVEGVCSMGYCTSA